MEQTQKKEHLFKKPIVQSVSAVVGVLSVLIGFLVWEAGRGVVSIEDSLLVAPVISLSPQAPGTLNALYVHEGERVAANTQVALVGGQTMTAVEDGIVASAPNLIGQYFTPGQPVVTIVHDTDMKVVGSVEETKGLSDISAGNRVVFTVDAFGSTKYDGIVESVSPTSNQTGVTFSISDKRAVQKFDVKVRFDASKYPELKNGMSAKMKIYTRE